MFAHHFQRLFFVCSSLVAFTIVISCNPDEDETGTPGGSGNTATLTTLPVSNITGNTTTTGGNITSDGGAAVTQRGVVWSTTPNPTLANNSTNDGSGIGSFISNLTGLTVNTTYYVRAYALSSAGTTYGNEVSFITSGTNNWLNPNQSYGSMTDQEGNSYTTVVVGTKEWMAKNLKTSVYANGDPIPYVSEGTQWFYLSTGAWVYYNNDPQYNNPYGKLYNWFAVADPRNVCPTGWHVATATEWGNLISTFDSNADGGLNINTAGGKLKSAGYEYWASPNTGATNESGFSALPGGLRGIGFGEIGSKGYWWTSTGGSSDIARYLVMDSENSSATSNNYYRSAGFSVRCVRN